MIYLDYAAATPMDERVLAAMRPYFQDRFYNPSALYTAARKVKADIDTARARVAQVLGAKPAEVIFTAGGTEANNIAIHGIMRRYPDKKVVVSAVEHESVIATAAAYTHALAPVHADGTIDISALERLITEDVVLISIMYANNEVGTIQPLREAAQLVERKQAERQKEGITVPLYLHTDATQAANYLDLHVSRLGVDMMTLNGGKIYGPKQSGVLYLKSGIALQTMLHGGGQERAVRSGTENVPGIIGFSVALELAQAMRSAETKRLGELQALFVKFLEQALPDAIVNGSLKRRLPNNIHVTFPGRDNEWLLMALDEAGIMAAAGSACSASNEEPSHVLRAMGIPVEQAQASIRFTLGRGTTEPDVHGVIEALARIIAS